MVGLNLLELSNLTNDWILHNLACLTMATKLPLDAPQFKWRDDDEPSNHIMSFYL